MSMSDPISDLITIVRNGQKAGLSSVTSVYSKLRESVLKVLKTEGYIKEYTIDGDGSHKRITIELKYYNSESVINNIKRVSKPGRRVYSAISDLQKNYNGLGIFILSTSKGVISDYDARLQNVGGEVLLSVY